MLNLELCVELGDHSIIDIGTIICDDSLWNTISSDKILFDESGHNILGDRSKGSCLNPLREVINSNKDEAVSVGSCMFDFSNHVNASH